MPDVNLTGFTLRLCLVILFPFSALHKWRFWPEAMAQARSSWLPGWTARPMLLGALALELVAPAMILAGWHERTAALALALYCVVSALLYHRFWRPQDFWVPAHSQARTEFWDFLKNFGLAGGLLLLAFGAQPGAPPASPDGWMSMKMDPGAPQAAISPDRPAVPPPPLKRND